MTSTYLGEYTSVRAALEDAHDDGDLTFYAPNFDIYIRVVDDTPAWPYHLVKRQDADRQFWTWQEMWEAP
jgi:hypothetical protein